MFPLSVKKRAGNYPLNKIIQSNELSTKKTSNEIVCRSPIWILSISLDISCRELNRKINHIRE